MKQIVDKLNKIAKKIDESVEIPQTDLIIDSLDAITKAYGGTPNDSNLIVDKLEDIYNNIGSGGGGGSDTPICCTVTIVDSEGTTGPLRISDVMLLNTDYQVIMGVNSYPTTLYAFYQELAGENEIADLNYWQPTEYYSATNFTNLINCQLITNSVDDGVHWHIEVLDKTLPSSITIDAKAFTNGSV